jgi:hypothetical protein
MEGIFMPQLLTHYLVMRRAIPEEHWDKWWNNDYKRYFGLGTTTPDLFYFPLVPTVKIRMRPDVMWGNTAGILHSNGSYDMFCALLDIAKRSKLQSQDGIEPKRQFAFAVGYYAHVVTDCIFHPYVYRNTEDLWFKVDRMPEVMHKTVEYNIDRALRKLYEARKMNFSHIEWMCNDGHDERPDILDFQIAKMLNEALNNVYPDVFPYQEEKISSENHLIQQAYSALLRSAKLLFEGKNIILFGVQEIVDFSKLKVFDENFFDEQIENVKGLPSHSYRDLFNFSCETVQRVLNVSLKFLNEPNMPSSKDFFAQNKDNYIGKGNWNLDTGLYCEYNNHEYMHNGNKAIHFIYKSIELTEIYKALESQYNPKNFPEL